MSVQVGCGPPQRIDGPLPQAPRSNLLSVARLVEDADAAGVERWGNGVRVYPFPTDEAIVWDASAPASAQTIKDSGTGVFPLPEFGAFIVYLAEKASTAGIWAANMSIAEAQTRFVARARASMAAVEGAAVEAEFMAGSVLGNNLHLADGNGTFPWNDNPTSIGNSFALLENEIAVSGKAGVIHCTPAAVTAAVNFHILEWDQAAGVLRTIIGTPVVAGYGYVQADSTPDGHAAATGTQEWMFATGPIEYRRSDIMLTPENFSQAFDREENEVVYRVERLYVLDWDGAVHAAVLADRCTTACGSPS